MPVERPAFILTTNDHLKTVVKGTIKSVLKGKKIRTNNINISAILL